MSLPPHILAPAFRQPRLSRLFAVLVALMVYLAAFAMAAEAGLFAVSFTWDASLARGLTVEIPAIDDESSTTQAERVTQAAAVLRAMPDVAQVKPVPDQDVARLLKPWLAEPELLKTLPMPTLIDVELTAGSTATAAAIEDKLKATVKDARIDDHGAWLAGMQRLKTALGALGAAIILLAAITLAATVSLVCRVLMANERTTIELLHSLGAEDGDIAKHFQFHARRLARAPALAGCFLAALSAAALVFLLRPVAEIIVLPPLHWLGLGLAVAAVPVIAVGIAAGAARASALNLLRAMP